MFSIFKVFEFMFRFDILSSEFVSFMFEDSMLCDTLRLLVNIASIEFILVLSVCDAVLSLRSDVDMAVSSCWV